MVGVLLRIAVGMAENLAGNREQLRRCLRDDAVLWQLDGIDRAAVSPEAGQPG